MSALGDRRQRAREAYHDAMARIDTVTGMPAIEEAIETATRVRIDEDTLTAAQNDYIYKGDLKSAIIAAFRAAGFEVEQ